MKYSLNEEQEQAFRILVNHATHPSGENLLLYVCGMAGTGKSQVIKAWKHFFKRKNQPFRFMVMAPTASAAAVVGGSTYHSTLGFQKSTPMKTVSALNTVRERLDHVDYIFLDEISMVDCTSFYEVSAQMCVATGLVDYPFGAKNFVIAGDPAQLPPVKISGPPLYSDTVGSVIHKTHALKVQKQSMGKALYHQFIHVVMLRQNMRQKGQSAEDAAYRKVLENMRYMKCTQADLDLMLTRVAGRGPNNPKIYDKEFRSVTIITGRNAQRDQTNVTRGELFAKDTGQQLVTFYSIDKFRTWADTEKKIERKRGKKPVDLTRQTDDVNGNLQDALWNLWPARTEHHPGKLQLCKGMPIMIKDNQATELAVTNGAEAEVVDWTSHPLPDGKLF